MFEDSLLLRLSFVYTNKRNRTEASYSRPLACLASDWLRNAEAMRKVGSWSTLRKAALRRCGPETVPLRGALRLRRCDHCGWPFTVRLLLAIQTATAALLVATRELPKR